MEIAVQGRHVQLATEERAHAVTKVEQLTKYLHGMERAEVIFSDAKRGHLAEPVTCELTLEGHGHVVRAQAVGNSPGAALEVATDKASLLLTKLKTKLVGRSRPRHKLSKAAIDGRHA